MPNYQNGKIYKIESLEGECVYYGSTIQKLCVRMAEHRKHYKIKRGITSEHILCFDDAKIYLVENYPCNSKEELHAREGYYIKNNDCVNKKIPGRTRKEYRETNKVKIKNYKKEYRETHKEKIKEEFKQWFIKNRDIHNKQSKLRYQKNKLRYLKNQNITRNNDIYICICGTLCKRYRKNKHDKTEKHHTLLNNPFINFKL